MIIINRHRAAVINTPHRSEIRPLIDRTTCSINRCSLAEETLPAGSAVKPHYHMVTEEIYYVLQGRGEMTIDDETRTVETGDAVFIPLRVVHSLKNTGDEAMTILLVCGAAYSPDDHIFV